MNRDSYKALVGLTWLALPITAMKYWLAWDRLPMRMAVHFDANWQPNGYSSREGAAMLGIGILAFMLVVFTIATLAARALKREASWPVLILSYVVLGFVWYGNNSIVKWNLQNSGQSPHAALVGSEAVFSNSFALQNDKFIDGMS